jgi:hypothetical protein
MASDAADVVQFTTVTRYVWRTHLTYWVWSKYIYIYIHYTWINRCTSHRYARPKTGRDTGRNVSGTRRCANLQEWWGSPHGSWTQTKYWGKYSYTRRRQCVDYNNKFEITSITWDTVPVHSPTHHFMIDLITMKNSEKADPRLAETQEEM